eukprot:4695328-Pleurochrysis_carterae.AAC.3
MYTLPLRACAKYPLPWRNWQYCYTLLNCPRSSSLGVKIDILRVACAYLSTLLSICGPAFQSNFNPAFLMSGHGVVLAVALDHAFPCFAPLPVYRLLPAPWGVD